MQITFDITKVCEEAVLMTMLLIILVFIDTFSKWISISTRYNKDKAIENTLWNILRGIFFRAWTKGYLESRKYREELGKKTLVYSASIFLAVVVHLMPNYRFQGILADETIAFFVYLALVLAECFSIAENFKETGVIGGDWIKKVIIAVANKYGIRVDENIGKTEEEGEEQK